MVNRLMEISGTAAPPASSSVRQKGRRVFADPPLLAPPTKMTGSSGDLVVLSSLSPSQSAAEAAAAAVMSDAEQPVQEPQAAVVRSRSSFPFSTSVHHSQFTKRVTADRLQRLDRLFAGGQEGQPGVICQVGFGSDTTLQQQTYSASLPSAPSPPPPPVSIPHTAAASGAELLSPQPASADSTRFLPHNAAVSFFPTVDERREGEGNAAAAVEQATSLLRRLSSSASLRPAAPSFSNPSSRPLPLLSPSPASAFAAPALPSPSPSPLPDADQPAQSEAEAAANLPPQQRNTLLRYWNVTSGSSFPSSRSRQPQQDDEDDAMDIVEIIDTETDRRAAAARPSSSSLSSAHAGRRQQQPERGKKGRDGQSAAVQDSEAVLRLRELLERKDAELRQLSARVEEGQERLREQERILREQAAREQRELREEQERWRREAQEALVSALRDKLRLERAEADRQLLLDQHDIGRIVSVREGISLVDGWVEGEKVREARERTQQLSREQEQLVNDIRRAKRKATNIKAKQKKTAAADSAAAAAASASPSPSLTSFALDDNGGFARPAPVELRLRCDAEEEALSIRLSEVRQELAELSESLQAMEVRRKQIIRQQKLRADEAASKFRSGSLLHDGRYLLTELLGKGGFSEVWKAFDVLRLGSVAIKLHQLNPGWTQERKNNYVRHATREYNIHQQLQHSHVVAMLDVFPLTQQLQGAAAAAAGAGSSDAMMVDSYGFASVLEFCNGLDLDYRLKLKGTLSERESRNIIRQLFLALHYFSHTAAPQRIIHYDLKPGNILFHDHHVKVTDFGLSKVLNDSAAADGSQHNTSMELTSQGAGTYWYLPPECFPDNSSDPTLPSALSSSPSPASFSSSSSAAPMISSKVDIFSAGVILYQMLTGKKPFGHGQSPAALLHQSIMKRANGRTLDWPAGCQVSPVAREFVSRCLAAKPADRPDISRIFDEPFFTAVLKDEQPPGLKRKRPAAGGSSGAAPGGADAAAAAVAAAGMGWGK